jgi:hypothetical protein
MPALSGNYSLRSHRVLFPYLVLVSYKYRNKTVPIVCRYPIVAYSRPSRPLPQSFRRFEFPFPPNTRSNFTAFPVIRANKSYFVRLLPYIRPELVCFKSIETVPKLQFLEQLPWI